LKRNVTYWKDPVSISSDAATTLVGKSVIKQSGHIIEFVEYQNLNFGIHDNEYTQGTSIELSRVPSMVGCWRKACPKRFQIG
jgi:hypothetical protein